MSRNFEIFGYWMEFDGRRVTIDGLAYVLRCREYTARYPRVERVIDVSAEAVSKSSAHYRSERNKLGDDWSIDVLASDVELQTAILTQLEPPKPSPMKEMLDAVGVGRPPR